MPKFTMIATPIYANPKTFPASQLSKLDKKLTRYMRDQIGPKIKRDMEATTVNWRGAPVFVCKYSEPYNTRKQVDIFPTGRNTLKWMRVSEGTGPRIISAKPGSMMVFPKEYMPKTTPGGRYGGPGRKYGPIVKAKTVRHSIAPRHFTLKIKEKREKEFIAGVNKIVWDIGKY